MLTIKWSTFLDATTTQVVGTTQAGDVPSSVRHLPRSGDFHSCLHISLALLSHMKMKDYA